MKTPLLIITILLAMAAGAQEITIEQAKVFADRLVQKNFLTAKGSKILFQEIARKNIEVDYPSTIYPVSHTTTRLLRETIIEFCVMAMITEWHVRLDDKKYAIENRIQPKEPLAFESWTSYPPLFWGGRKEYTGCISNQTSTIGYTRMKTLRTFYEAGLINDQVFQTCKKALEHKQVKDEIELLRLMLHKSIQYTFYEFHKQEQKTYIEKLVANGLLHENATNALFPTYTDYHLNTIPEILRFSPRYLQVDVQNLPADPSFIYPFIFENLTKLIPNFSFSKLTAVIQEEKDHELIRQDIQLSFDVNNTTYKHVFFYNYRRQNPTKENPDLPAPRIAEEFHKGINKWLADIANPFRLYTVSIREQDDSYENKSIGFLLLREGEDSVISQDQRLISTETFDQRFTTQNLHQTVNELLQNGFFSHLTPSQIDVAKGKIAASEISTIEELLLHFPNTIVVFDWETGNLENPYEELTREFAVASRGAFELLEIADDFKKGWNKAKKVLYGFTLNGKRFEKMLSFEGDWLDPGFLELLKSALKESGVNGQIYHCVDNGQIAGYIFLNPPQHRFIQEKHPEFLK